jgi:hypothetical protein
MKKRKNDETMMGEHGTTVQLWRVADGHSNMAVPLRSEPGSDTLLTAICLRKWAKPFDVPIVRASVSPHAHGRNLGMGMCPCRDSKTGEKLGEYCPNVDVLVSTSGMAVLEWRR